MSTLHRIFMEGLTVLAPEEGQGAWHPKGREKRFLVRGPVSYRDPEG